MSNPNNPFNIGLSIHDMTEILGYYVAAINGCHKSGRLLEKAGKAYGLSFTFPERAMLETLAKQRRSLAVEKEFFETDFTSKVAKIVTEEQLRKLQTHFSPPEEPTP